MSSIEWALEPRYRSDCDALPVPVAHVHWGISVCACAVEHERNKQSDWLRGNDVTSHDQMLQFDWLMTSHDYI